MCSCPELLLACFLVDRASTEPTTVSFLVCQQDFQFILKGVARLLSNPLVQTYLPNSAKKIQFHQELLVLFWKLCDFNKVRICLLLGFAPPVCLLPRTWCGSGWTELW